MARTLARLVGEGHFVKMWSWDFVWCGGASDAKMSDKVSQQIHQRVQQFYIGNDFGVSEGLKEGSYSRT